MFNVSSLYIKLIIAGILVAILGAGGFYVLHMNNKIESLQTENLKLDEANKSAVSSIEENERRSIIVDEVNSLGNKERIIIEKKYQSKLNKIDILIKDDKDREVGPLLKEFFND